MANELLLIYNDSSSVTLYAVIHMGNQIINNSTGQPMTRNISNWGSAAIPLSGAACQDHYLANWPGSVAAGAYLVGFYNRIGGSPSPVDTFLSSEKIIWNGSAVCDLSFGSSGLAMVNASEWGSQDASVDADNNPFIGTVNKLSSTAIAQIAAVAGGGDGGSGVGDGDTPVDHDTLGVDHFRYTLGDTDIGADNVTIKAYLKSDYVAGDRTVRGRTITGADGRWLAPLMLNSGDTYEIVAVIPGSTQAQINELVVP